MLIRRAAWWLAWTLGVAGVGIFVAANVWLIFLKPDPDRGPTFRSGESVEVPLQVGETRTIWLDVDTSFKDKCRITGPGTAELDTNWGSKEGDPEARGWTPLYDVTADRDGVYVVRCGSSGGPQRYAIGDPDPMWELYGWLIGVGLVLVSFPLGVYGATEP